MYHLLIAVCGAVVVGPIGAVESRLYTDAQRQRAPRLVALKQESSVLLVLLGSVGLAGLAAGVVPSTGAVTTTLVLVLWLAVAVDRLLLSRLDCQHGPLYQRFQRWWRHPADR